MIGYAAFQGDEADLDDEGCIDGYPEHDFDEIECRRCGAEPDYEEDEDES